MGAARSAMARMRAGTYDQDLVETMLTARSGGEAALAFSLLRESLPEDTLVFLANLREVLADLPAPPFRTGVPLDILQRVLDYERIGRSYRQTFACEEGMFGIEFIGRGNLVESIRVITSQGRFAVYAEDDRFDTGVLELSLRYDCLFDDLFEALSLLSLEIHPKIYLTSVDFLIENANNTLSDLDTFF